jgi:hypothetical protein
VARVVVDSWHSVPSSQLRILGIAQFDGRQVDRLAAGEGSVHRQAALWRLSFRCPRRCGLSVTLSGPVQWVDTSVAGEASAPRVSSRRRFTARPPCAWAAPRPAAQSRGSVRCPRRWHVPGGETSIGRLCRSEFSRCRPADPARDWARHRVRWASGGSSRRVVSPCQSYAVTSPSESESKGSGPTWVL